VGFVHKEIKGSHKPKYDNEVHQYVAGSSIEKQYGGDNYACTEQKHASFRKGIERLNQEYPECSQAALAYAVLVIDLLYGNDLANCMVCDIGDVEYNPKTSTGFMFSELERRKRRFMEKYGDVIEEFNNIMKKKKYDRDDPERPWVIWNGSVKFEIAKITKIEEAMERLFCVAPVTLDIVSGAVTIDFDARIKNRWYSKPIKNGMTKFEGGLNAIAQYMNAIDGEFTEGDGKNFDSTVTPQMLFAIRDYRISKLKFKTPENVNRLYNYYTELVYSKIRMYNGQIIEKHGGMPSGARTTAIDDSLVNLMSRAVVYYEAYIRQHGTQPTPQQFVENFRYCLCGDDELDKHTVVPECDATQTGDLLKKYTNLEYPPERVVKSKDLNGLSFVGVKFRWLPTHKSYVGVPAYPGKILASWYLEEKQLTRAQRKGKAISLMIETYWEKNLYQFIRRYVEENFDINEPAAAPEGMDENLFQGLPTDQQIEDLWLGFERKTRWHELNAKWCSYNLETMSVDDIDG